MQTIVFPSSNTSLAGNHVLCCGNRLCVGCSSNMLEVCEYIFE